MKVMEGKVERGELLLLTQGVYSDYSIITLVKVLKGFDVATLKTEWLALHPEQERDGFNHYLFAAWLAAEGMVEDLVFREFYLGEYDGEGIDDMEIID